MWHIMCSFTFLEGNLDSLTSDVSNRDSCVYREENRRLVSLPRSLGVCVCVCLTFDTVKETLKTAGWRSHMYWDVPPLPFGNNSTLCLKVRESSRQYVGNIAKGTVHICRMRVLHNSVHRYG